MKCLHILFFLLLCKVLPAQKKEQFLDASLKPVNGTGYYFAVTEKKDGRWYREVYYVRGKSLAISGWYKDEDCKMPDGEVSSFYLNKMIQSKINYTNGKKNGQSLRFHQNGMLRDSSQFIDGYTKGISLGWDSEGYLVDSSVHDGAGNSTSVRWYPKGGSVFSAGRFKNDTLKVNRWKYYHANGQTLAFEDYDNDGKKISCSCFDENGKQLDQQLCEKEEEASFPGEESGWRRFLERNLDAATPVRNRAPEGMYTVMISFVVNSNGQLTDIKADTDNGYGMEQEVIRLLKKSPPWKPAFQFGRNVKAYRKQPVTFVVSKE